MTYYKLRVDAQVLDYINSISRVYFYCHEGGEENPHTHFYLETQVKAPTIRNNLRRLGLKGNGGYSLKSCEKNPIEYIAYMMKEGNWTNVGLPPEIIDEAKQYDTRIKKEMKDKKEARIPVWKKIMATLPHQNADYNTIIEYVCKYHIENELLIRKFQIECYVETIYAQLHPDTYWRHMANLIMKNHPIPIF